MRGWGSGYWNARFMSLSYGELEFVKPILYLPNLLTICRVVEKMVLKFSWGGSFIMSIRKAFQISKQNKIRGGYGEIGRIYGLNWIEP